MFFPAEVSSQIEQIWLGLCFVKMYLNGISILLKSHFGMFSCKLAACFQNTFSWEHLWMAASGNANRVNHSPVT